MKKYLVLVLIVLVMGALFVGVVAAPAGNSNTGLLYLYEKDAAWDIVPGGAWGKMEYKLSGLEFDFVFNGKGLEAGVEYTLIYYPDPWPGTGLICLGSATANNGGNVHIAGPVEIDTDLPADFDDPEYEGAKIWLVLNSDIECGVSMTDWNPAEYLFEDEVINFDDTDA